MAPIADDKIKVIALIKKLSESVFSEYKKFCLPSEVIEFNFDIKVIKRDMRNVRLFAKPQSIFIYRYQCLIAYRTEGEASENSPINEDRSATNAM